MKLTVKGADLHRAAAWAAKIAPSNPHSPVMAGVLLTAGESVTLAASDLETFGTVTVAGAVVKEDGRTVVSARLLAAVAKQVEPSAEAVIALDGSKLVVTTGRSRWALPEMEPDLWPQFPDVGAPIGKVDGAVFERALSRVIPAAGGPDAEPKVLSGVQMQFGDLLALAATDRYRIAIADIAWQPALGEHELITVPATVLKHAALNSEVTISAENGVFGIQSGAHTVIGRLLAGKPLPVREVAQEPKRKAATVVTVETEKLREAVDNVAVMLNDKSHLILEFSTDGIYVSPANGTGDADSNVDMLRHIGPAIQIKIKHEVISGGLRCLDSEFAVLTFTDRAVAGFMAQPASDNGTQIDETYLHVMMPMVPGKS